MFEYHILPEISNVLISFVILEQNFQNIFDLIIFYRIIFYRLFSTE